MNIEWIERMLEQGERVGFRKPLDGADFVGWVLVAKVKANARLLELVSEDEDPLAVAEERRRLERPYLVLDIELNRKVHDDGAYETESDYRRKDRQWFASLRDVELHLKEVGYALSEAKSARELDAP